MSTDLAGPIGASDSHDLRSVRSKDHRGSEALASIEPPHLQRLGQCTRSAFSTRNATHYDCNLERFDHSVLRSGFDDYIIRPHLPSCELVRIGAFSRASSAATAIVDPSLYNMSVRSVLKGPTI